MKKFLVGFALPAAAAIAVVGSGFSVWYFGDKVQGESGASINVTQLVKVGSFTQDASSKIILDQTSEGRAANGNGLGTGLEASGIYMEGEGENWKGTIAYNSSNSDKVDGKVKTSIKTYIFVPKTVSVYISVKGADSYTFETYAVSTGSASAKSFTSDNYVGYVYTWGENTTSIKLPTSYKDENAFFYFDYQSGKEPKNETEYGALKEAVKDQQISIVSEATLVKA